MTDTFIMCDRVVHVARALSVAPRATILALTPQVVEVCERDRIAHTVLESYVDAAAVNRFGETVTSREYEMAAWIDATLAEEMPEFRQMKFSPAGAQIAFLKRTLDCYLLPAAVLVEFLRTVGPRSVTVFERPPFFPGAVQRPLYPLLVPELAPSDTLVTILKDDDLSRAERLHDAGSLRRYWIARRLARRVWHTLKRLRAKRLHGDVQVAWLGVTGYDFDFAVPLLAERGIEAVRPPHALLTGRSVAESRDRLRRAISPLVGRLLTDERLWTAVDAVSPRLRPIVNPWLRRWFMEELPRFWAEFLAYRDWLAGHSFAAAVGIEVDNTQTSAGFHAARSLGIPRVARIHNTGQIQDLPPVDCLGPTQCDVLMVAGEGDVAYYDELARRYPTLPHGKTVPVGSARLERIAKPDTNRVVDLRRRLQRGDSRLLIMYVPTMLMGCYRYFAEGYISDTEYIALQQRIMRCFRDFPNIRVFYKPMQLSWTRDPMADFIAREIPNAQVVQTRLTDLMWAVDAIVVDFSATAITEVVLTDKPLLIYAGRDWARMLPDAKAALADRARISETADEFEQQVREFLTTGDYSPVAPATEFLRRYCTHTSDGRSAERMAELIETVALRREVPLPEPDPTTFPSASQLVWTGAGS